MRIIPKKYNREFGEKKTALCLLVRIIRHEDNISAIHSQSWSFLRVNPDVAVAVFLQK